MSKKTGETNDEFAALQLPSHSLPNETAQKLAFTPQATASGRSDGKTSSKVQLLHDRAKQHPGARGTPGYQTVLDSIERRRGREMRRTLRIAEAARRKQQYRNITLAALLVIALGLAVVLLTRR
jgi:hypothetical protein